MEKSTDQTTRETHDFMNVESFSQLPFIRPVPVKEKPIRLFGKEFGGGDYGDDNSESSQTNVGGGGASRGDSKDNIGNSESTRKFECHYCCRNFPTSQALGGHQNAHKRERQHAKRAHLQSAMVHGSLTEAHVYGFMNYRLAGAVGQTGPSALQTSARYQNSYNGVSPRFYGNAGSYDSYSSPHPPITGSPMGWWRIPEAQHSSAPAFSRDGLMNHHSLPLFGNEELRSAQVSTGAQALLGYESKAKMQDHVSLDLHL